MKHLVPAVLVIMALGAPMAQAEPGHKKGHGQAHSGGPPGLAKKPHGMPPGQAKKAWSRGQRMPTTYLNQRYYVEPTRYGLSPAPAGYRWVRVDDQAYLAQTRTGLISQVVAGLLQ